MAKKGEIKALLQSLAERRYGRGGDDRIKKLLYFWHHQQRLPITLIAAKLKCCTKTVRMLLLDYQIPVRNQYRKASTGPLPVGRAGFQSEREFFLAYCDESYAKMAADLEVNEKQVRERFAKFKNRWVAYGGPTRERRKQR